MVDGVGWPLADRASRAMWRAAGRRVDLDGAHSWLASPVSGPGEVRDSWLGAEARRIGGTVADSDPADGLMVSMDSLAGPDFDPALLHADVREFYEHTARWRMDAWTQWSRGFGIPGAAIESLYGRRVQQLALPVNPLAVAHGVDSAITRILDADGGHAGSAWLRTLRKTGDYLYSGYYRTTLLPGHEQISVHVTFPLEQGNVQVFLKPSNGPGGSLRLSSPAGAFGDDGAYTTVHGAHAVHAARAPIHEEFHVYLDDEGVLRTDHTLKLWKATAVRLHYRLVPR